MEQLPSCYNHYDKHADNCKKCKVTQYCQDSTECERAAFSDHYEYVDNVANNKHFSDDRRYSSTHIVQVSRCLLNIASSKQLNSKADELIKNKNASTKELKATLKQMLSRAQTCEIVKDKIECPDLTLADFAEVKGVKRQAIHKSFKKITTQYPEMDDILHNKKNYGKAKRKTKGG